MSANRAAHKLRITSLTQQPPFPTLIAPRFDNPSSDYFKKMTLDLDKLEEEWQPNCIVAELFTIPIVGIVGWLVLMMRASSLKVNGSRKIFYVFSIISMGAFVNNIGKCSPIPALMTLGTVIASLTLVFVMPTVVL